MCLCQMLNPGVFFFCPNCGIDLKDTEKTEKKRKRTIDEDDGASCTCLEILRERQKKMQNNPPTHSAKQGKVGVLQIAGCSITGKEGGALGCGVLCALRGLLLWPSFVLSS